MEALKEALLSRNIVAWAIVVILVVLVLKLLQSAGKGLAILLMILALGFVLMKFFPDLMAPVIEFMRGGWMNDSGR